MPAIMLYRYSMTKLNDDIKMANETTLCNPDC
jgi:hypothetical protein